MESGIDAVKIDSCVLKSCASAHASAQNGRTGNDIGELSAHPHDLVGIGDAFKIDTTASSGLGVFGCDHERLVTRPETRPDDERAVAADVGLDEIAGEPLRLRLCADEDCDTENDTAQTQKQCPLAMRQKTQGNVKRGGHGAFGGAGALIVRSRTG